MQHILVTTDLSSESLVAIEAAKAQMRSSEDGVTLLTVIETPVLLGDPADALVAFGDLEELLNSQEKSARESLKGLAKLHFPNRSVTCEVVRTGIDAAQAIVEYVEESGVSLIVMATHGRRGFRRFFLGSVTERVLRHTEVPILVIPIIESE